MVIWQIIGNEIGPEGNGAAHFSTKAKASNALVEYRKGRDPKVDAMGDGPFKITISNREQLARALDDAMGYGCS